LLAKVFQIICEAVLHVHFSPKLSSKHTSRRHSVKQITEYIKTATEMPTASAGSPIAIDACGDVN